MGYIVKDTMPQNGMAESYFVGFRKVKDPMGRDCEAADFGEKMMAKEFRDSSEAQKFASSLNQMAKRTQFVIEEKQGAVYGMKYGKRRERNNGFLGIGTIPSEEPHAESMAGFNWHGTYDGNGGYNGF